tara:strand:- start:1611 stop:2438 length:828 start_codon:yes stop_codon:yes gene_type:complete
MNELRLVIIGHGFVGKAVDFGFNLHVTKLIIDPKYGNSIADIKEFNPDVIFICVPTPSNDDSSIDLSLVEGVLTELEVFSQTLIVLKSTIVPSFFKSINNRYENLVYNPEFLTERNANQDFISQPMLILGGKETYSKKLEYIYKNHSSCHNCPTLYLSRVEASVVKYAINSYLATKVTFFNQIYDLVEDCSGDYDKVRKAITSDPRITDSHTLVPGHDGKRGFGGACFPKDISAIYLDSDKLTLLKQVADINRAYRKAYSLDDRERSQNIKFGDS